VSAAARARTVRAQLVLVFLSYLRRQRSDDRRFAKLKSDSHTEGLHADPPRSASTSEQREGDEQQDEVPHAVLRS